ncbi:MAG: hypothetical protein NTZ35_04000 [Ignavibacteriales bacterium]|nr:hypothetical protein [Ignavibacteriales bacterium]
MKVKLCRDAVDKGVSVDDGQKIPERCQKGFFLELTILTEITR